MAISNRLDEIDDRNLYFLRYILENGKSSNMLYQKKNVPVSIYEMCKIYEASVMLSLTE